MAGVADVASLHAEVLRALVPSAGYVNPGWICLYCYGSPCFKWSPRYLSLTTLKGDANLHVLPAPSLVCGVSFKETRPHFGVGVGFGRTVHWSNSDVVCSLRSCAAFSPTRWFAAWLSSLPLRTSSPIRISESIRGGVQRAGHQALVPHGSYRIEAETGQQHKFRLAMHIPR